MNGNPMSLLLLLLHVATKLLFLLDKNFLIFWLNSWSSTGWLPPDRSISLFRGKKYWLIFFGRFYGFFIFAVVLGPFLRVNHFFVTLPTLATVFSILHPTYGICNVMKENKKNSLY